MQIVFLGELFQVGEHARESGVRVDVWRNGDIFDICMILNIDQVRVWGWWWHPVHDFLVPFFVMFVLHIQRRQNIIQARADCRLDLPD